MSLIQKTIQELAPLLKQKQISPVELVTACLEQIEKTEPELNAYITVFKEEPLRAANRAEKDILQGRYQGVLHGIPYSAKDLYYTKGIRTTGGSEVLTDFIPDYSATVIERLTQAGAILLGKNNLHEFAYGTTNENEYFGPCRNPWNTKRIPGGSSGGSAASVAAGSSIFSIGTDTGGSIRIPSALCGVTGLKPTYGRVSKYGVIPLSWSQDHAGPIAKSVWDNAAVLTAIAGFDPQDPVSALVPCDDYVEPLSRNSIVKIKGMRIGVCPDCYDGILEPDIAKVLKEVLCWFEDNGACIKTLSYPPRDIIGITGVLTMGEVYAYHERFLKTCPEKYGSIVRRRIEKSQYVPAHTYVNAQRLRQLDQQEWAKIYNEVDVVILPTTIVSAFPIGVDTIPFGDEEVDPRIHNTLTLMTAISDFNGYPAISLPCGFTAEGLPIGIQLQGKPFEEASLLQTAYIYEQTHTNQRLLPPLCC